MASHISTPGNVGRPGKWPAKNHSSPLNFQIVEAETPGVNSVISSTKMKGSRWAMRSVGLGNAITYLKLPAVLLACLSVRSCTTPSQ